MNSYIQGEIYIYNKIKFLVIELLDDEIFNIIWLDDSGIDQRTSPNIKDELVTDIFIGEV